jgi:Mn2+/Fe2+ NRAMP family transporter
VQDEIYNARSFIRKLGPGLVSGAADDDPSLPTARWELSSGYGLSWTMLFSFPLMAAVQATSARIGCVTGVGAAHKASSLLNDGALLRNWHSQLVARASTRQS